MGYYPLPFGIGGHFRLDLFGPVWAVIRNGGLVSRLIDAFSHIEIFQDPQGRGRVQAARCATGIYLARGALQAPLLVVASSSRQAGEYVDELRTYLGEDQVVEFAPW